MIRLNREGQNPVRSLSLDRVARSLFCRHSKKINTLVGLARVFVLGNGALSCVTRDDKETNRFDAAFGYSFGGMCFYCDVRHL